MHEEVSDPGAEARARGLPRLPGPSGTLATRSRPAVSHMVTGWPRKTHPSTRPPPPILPLHASWTDGACLHSADPPNRAQAPLQLPPINAASPLMAQQPIQPPAVTPDISDHFLSFDTFELQHALLRSFSAAPHQRSGGSDLVEQRPRSAHRCSSSCHRGQYCHKDCHRESQARLLLRWT